MKKYYVIRLAYDDGFYNKEEDNFVGWLKASKYESHSEACINIEVATQNKPCTVVEVYLNE